MADDATMAAQVRMMVHVVAMRFYRVLLTPWVATTRAARWLFVLVLLLVALGDVLANVYGFAGVAGATERAWAFNAVVFGVANAACWLLVVPNGVLLALAARRLRLPGVRHDVLWSLPLYAALGIGLPLLWQFPHGHVLIFAMLQGLLMVGALLFMMLPAYAALASYFLFLLLHQVAGLFIAIPRPSDPGFVFWGGKLIVVLLLVVAWRWRQLLRGDYAERGLRAPNLINLRRNMRRSQSDPFTDVQSLRVMPGWLLAHPDLRHAGPQAPVRSLRIALGGVYLPQTIVGRLYQVASTVLILALTGLFLFVVTFGDHGAEQALRYLFSRAGFRVVSSMLAVFGLMVVILPAELLAQHWGRVNTELSLLGLLPGLGEAGRSKRVLLRTVLEHPALRLGLLMLLGWLGVAMLDVGWQVALALLLVALGCLGYLYAMALSTFGGHPLPSFAKSLLMIAMFVLLSVTVLLPQLWQDWSVLYAWRALDALFAAWLVLALFLTWLGRRGWRGLQQRPHPFFPN